MVGHGGLGRLPEVPDVLHVDVEVEVAAHELRVPHLVLLVGMKRPQLEPGGFALQLINVIEEASKHIFMPLIIENLT